MNKDKRPMTIDSELSRIFGSDARSFYMANHLALHGITKPVGPKTLREVSPLAWDTTPFPADVEL